MKGQNLQLLRAITSLLLVCALAFSLASCIRVIPRSAVPDDSGATSSTPESEEDWELDDSGPAATQPSDSSGTTPSIVPGTGLTPVPTTTTTILPTGCDLKIQPASLNAAPGVYTFTAISSSSNNAIYQWDINGNVFQSGPQNTFVVDMNVPGTGTVSVTLIQNSQPVCKATAAVKIVQTVVTPQCDLKIQPATLNANLGTYTFWASTSYTNALFLWDIDGYQQAYGPSPSFSVTFTSAGNPKVSVTMIINGVPICKATSSVHVVPLIIK